MRVLDLFCGAGGASVGYSIAGFTDIVGVDISPQPHYPFRFIQADVFDFPLDFKDFDLVHASPPCQRYSNGARQWQTTDDHPDLIDPTRDMLIREGRPYVIENIYTAKAWMRNPVMLCGQTFGLGVFRHRLFETSIPVVEPPHERHRGRVGDGSYFTVAGHTGGKSNRDGWVGGSAKDWQRAMGIDWMTTRELAEAIPPAYTQYVGTQMLRKILPDRVAVWGPHD